MPFVENHEKFLRRAFAWATPFYKAATGFRNFLFDKDLCRSYVPALPVICVGNLCAGGSGKTPMTEYLVRLLLENIVEKPEAELTMLSEAGAMMKAKAEPEVKTRPEAELTMLSEAGAMIKAKADRRSKEGKVAVVTRGYGRRRKGSFEAEPGMDALQIGDEAVQYLDSFAEEAVRGRLALYLSTDRREGIETLQKRYSALRACILDDAFQHRQVDAGLNILISDFNKPFFRDRLLPRGNLRESRRGSRRAQIVVFSKCPENLDVRDKEEFLKEAALEPYQKAFFTYTQYGGFVDVSRPEAGLSETPQADPSEALSKAAQESAPSEAPSEAPQEAAQKAGLSETTQEAGISKNSPAPSHPSKPEKIFLFTGIANPQPLEDYLKRQGHKVLVHRRYGDHHAYTESELKVMLSLYRKLCEREGPVRLLTTQKDYCRLKNTPIFDYFCSLPLAYIPVRTGFLFDQKAEFDRMITNFVGL